jgi:hypothetical protein
MKKTACSGSQRLSQSTLLGFLTSRTDPDHVIVAATGVVLDVRSQTQVTIEKKFRDKTWLPIELSHPRNILLHNESRWQITDFDPTSREVCVAFYSNGVRHLSFTLPTIKF